VAAWVVIVAVLQVKLEVGLVISRSKRCVVMSAHWFPPLLWPSTWSEDFSRADDAGRDGRARRVEHQATVLDVHVGVPIDRQGKP
jgi:hypothetical protein